jgi:hypothetical protein
VVETCVWEHVAVAQQVLGLGWIDLDQQISLDDPVDALALPRVSVLVDGHVS